MQMPTIYGAPSRKAYSGISSKGDMLNALRQNDQDALHGMRKGWDEDTVLGGFGGFTGVVPGIQLNRFSDLQSYMKAGLQKVWCTARACELVADQIADTPLTFKRGEREEKRPNGDLLALLQAPNDFDTFSDMLWALTFHLKITGHGYWVKDEMNMLGQPKRLFWLNPAFVSITPDSKTMIRRFTYRVNGKDIDFEPEEIIYFRRPNPANPALGLGEMRRGETLYDEYINRSLYEEKFMENGGIPGSILVNEGFDGSDEEWAAKRSGFMERYGGLKNAGKQAWLSGKWDLLRLGITASEMQTLERSGVNAQDIFRNHGVPLSVAGYSSANYATAQVEMRNFLKFTVRPLLQMSIIDRLNHKSGIVQAYDPKLKIVGNLQGLIDVKEEAASCQPLVAMGAMTPNEARVRCGLPKVNNPYLDQYFINGTPIELSGIAAENPVSVGAGNKPEADTPDEQGDTQPQQRPAKKPKPKQPKDGEEV